MSWIAAAIAALIPLQLVSDAWERAHEHVSEWDLAPAPDRWWRRYVRLIAFHEAAGYDGVRGRETRRLIVLILPSWDWQPTDFGRGPWAWHRAHLLRYSDERRWRLLYLRSWWEEDDDGR